MGLSPWEGNRLTTMMRRDWKPSREGGLESITPSEEEGDRDRETAGDPSITSLGPADEVDDDDDDDVKDENGRFNHSAARHTRDRLRESSQQALNYSESRHHRMRYPDPTLTLETDDSGRWRLTENSDHDSDSKILMEREREK